MKLYRERHRTIAKCTEDFDRGQFNTAISAVMELVNAASAYLNATEGTARDKALCYGVAKDIVSVLAPICPFWADELWHEALGCEGNAYTAAWPEFDLAESIEDTVQIVVQVLGKVRGRVDVARDASNEDMQLPPRKPSPSGLRQDGRQGHLRARQAGQPGGQVSIARLTDA